MTAAPFSELIAEAGPSYCRRTVTSDGQVCAKPATSLYRVEIRDNERNQRRGLTAVSSASPRCPECAARLRPYASTNSRAWLEAI